MGAKLDSRLHTFENRVLRIIFIASKTDEIYAKRNPDTIAQFNAAQILLFANIGKNK
jgi:hypothetical protein